MRVSDLAGAVATFRRLLAAEPVLVRIRLAHQVAEALRRAESQFCTMRDEAIREDRVANPDRTVDDLVDVTGVSRASVVNARRISRPTTQRVAKQVTGQ